MYQAALCQGSLCTQQCGKEREGGGGGRLPAEQVASYERADDILRPWKGQLKRHSAQGFTVWQDHHIIYRAADRRTPCEFLTCEPPTMAAQSISAHRAAGARQRWSGPGGRHHLAVRVAAPRESSAFVAFRLTILRKAAADLTVAGRLAVPRMLAGRLISPASISNTNHRFPKVSKLEASMPVICHEDTRASQGAMHPDTPSSGTPPCRLHGTPHSDARLALWA